MTLSYSPVFAGYEAKRDSLRAWLQRHYLAEFGLKPGTLLDLGCGNGFWDGLFAEAGFTVTGIDIKADYIHEARVKYPDVVFDIADVRDPLSVGMFDTVFIRTISAFYQPSLGDAELVIENALKHTSGNLLLSFYTDGSGEARPGLVSGTPWHHTVDDYLMLVRETGGTIRKTAQVGNYLQVLAR